MAEQQLTMFCMAATPFHEDGSVDEDALRVHLTRIVDARNGLYVAGGGAGEGHVLSPKECRQVYEVSVDVAKGKVPLNANPREERSAKAVLEYMKEAVAAGIDTVQVYQLEGGHGMVPTQYEQEKYFGTILDVIQHPVAISIHAAAHYTAPIPMLKDLCARYEQISAFNIMGIGDNYFMRLRDVLPARVKLYGSLSQVLYLGASGTLEAESNIIPKTCQGIIDGYLAGDMAKVTQNAQFLQRFRNIVNEWAPSTARWVKMGMKVMGLGNGVLRPPYMLPGEADQKKMAAAFAALGVREAEGMARTPATA